MVGLKRKKHYHAVEQLQHPTWLSSNKTSPATDKKNRSHTELNDFLTALSNKKSCLHDHNTEEVVAAKQASTSSLNPTLIVPDSEKRTTRFSQAAKVAPTSSKSAAKNKTKLSTKSAGGPILIEKSAATINNDGPAQKKKKIDHTSSSNASKSAKSEEESEEYDQQSISMRAFNVYGERVVCKIFLESFS